ncbi:UPF0187-domain-containing protein [Tothia fuscella]|uniref:UPF0187-domain-containing protein n=1 Tax=Tothia fuscella TaxID=1048955 RepID=A0A9P4NM51_9PEZI|nr:UPF0187-domain-containing protein [Tothia fuscella]
MSEEAAAPAANMNAVHDPAVTPIPVHKGGATATTAGSTTDVEHDHDRHSLDNGPLSPRMRTNPFSRVQTSLDMDDYFVGPRDMSKHSKWPVFMRLHGSILPEMILPLIFVGGWSTLITCISKYKHDLGINPVLLTVLGFVVGLGLSFRSSTAYERYAEGRKYWTQLAFASHNLARVIWIHSVERKGDLSKQDLLTKLSGLNLIIAFAVSLKHKLRFEPYASYEDLSGLIGHLDTFAKAATTPGSVAHKKPNFFKTTGEFLGVSFAESNPRKVIKKAAKPLGNLPLEILTYMSSFVDEQVEQGLLKVPMHQTLAYNNIAALNDVLTGTDRILNTPLPVAYSIAIAQVTWMYIIMLPFQLYKALGWVTIPGSIFAAYIILGILLIGREIENPFGNDVNDLPLDHFCFQLATELDTISAIRKPNTEEWVKNSNNKVLFPILDSGYLAWEKRSELRIRTELRSKPEMALEARKHKIELTPSEPSVADEKV